MRVVMLKKICKTMWNLETRKMQREMQKIPIRTAMMTMKMMMKMEKVDLQESNYSQKESKTPLLELPWNKVAQSSLQDNTLERLIMQDFKISS